MKRVLVIGVGAGGSDLLTVQAIEALKRADVIFTFDKGAEKDDLVQLRKEICERYCDRKPYRLIEVPSPQRDPAAASYKAGVAVWHKARADIVKALIRDELSEKAAALSSSGATPPSTTARCASSRQSRRRASNRSNTR